MGAWLPWRDGLNVESDEDGEPGKFVNVTRLGEESGWGGVRLGEESGCHLQQEVPVPLSVLLLCAGPRPHPAPAGWRAGRRGPDGGQDGLSHYRCGASF